MTDNGFIPFQQAVSLALSEHKRTILTEYRVGVLIFELYLAGQIHGRKLRVKNPLPARRHFLDALNYLVSYGLLKDVRGFPARSVFTTMGRSSPDPFELICAVDPFAYISHLSAMTLHGLTDRVPHTLFASSPAPAAWRGYADEQMRKDLGSRLSNYRKAGFPRLLRTRLRTVLGQPIHLAQSIHLGAFKRLEPQGVRVASIGRTFLDMLRDPDLCGGIHHVLDVYQQHSKPYLALIVSEVEQHGTAIDKVRAGYVLEELCHMGGAQVDAWQRFATRGGSRKLVANNPYSAMYSEKWCLSLNTD